MRILIIDDEASIRKVIRVALQADQHQIDEASGAEEALAHVERERFELCILDLKLGNEDGIELLP